MESTGSIDESEWWYHGRLEDISRSSSRSVWVRVDNFDQIMCSNRSEMARKLLFRNGNMGFTATTLCYF